jgi:hypothetical protein
VFLRQRGFQTGRRLHAAIRRVESAMAQRPQRQLRVVFGVFDQQDFDRFAHAGVRSGGA